MGATDCYVRVKGKTQEAIRKEFWSKVEEVALDVSDEDLGYSGTAAEFTHLQFTNRTFDSFEQLQDWLAPKEKNTAFVVQVKEVKDTQTIQKWIIETRAISNQLWVLPQDDSKARKPLTRKLDALHAKIAAARARKAAKTTKTQTYCAGWVSE